MYYPADPLVHGEGDFTAATRQVNFLFDLRLDTTTREQITIK
jgi:hypothetical protein